MNSFFRCPISNEELHFQDLDVPNYGFFISKRSHYIYPVINGVPIFLPYQTLLTASFFKNFENTLILKYSDYQLPRLKIPPGEKSVAETFTDQWLSTRSSEFSFIYNKKELFGLHRYCWLYGLSDGECLSKELVLDVGCGNGQEAIALSEIFPNASVFALDLNPNLISLSKRIQESSMGKVLPLIASLWYPPFNEASFDHVHFQGVAHHTYSTDEAFRNIAKYPKQAKSSYFFWVYALEDSMGIPGFRGLLIRLYWLVSHKISRPILSRAPKPIRTVALWAITYAYICILFFAGRRNPAGWTQLNTFHGISDMFSPRYAHQLRWNEVLCWFAEKDYRNILPQDPLYYKNKFNKRLLGIGVLGLR
jgi:SAM-dependent methyltransferase